MEARNWGVSHWLNGDIASGNLHTLRKETGVPDYVVHLAGGSSVGSAIAQPREDFNRTVVGTMELFEWLRLESPKTRVLAVSTAAVYGADHSGMIPEGAVLRPYSPYGFHKLMMESICESYAASFGLRSIIARLFSVYGVGLKKQLLWDLCNKLHGDPGKVELGGTGDELRDWVSVSDVARIFVQLCELATAEVPRLNVGTGTGISVRHLAERLIEAWHGNANSHTLLSFNGLSRPGDPFSLVASPEKLSQLGLKCGTSAFGGIAQYVDWFKESSASRVGYHR
jgi:UDP-glucose 4-epimerase